MDIKASEIRREYDILQEALLNEKFVKEDDPSIVVQKFMLAAENELSHMRKVYNDRARDRNDIVDPALKGIRDLVAAAKKAYQMLRRHKTGTTAPEDNNRSVGMDLNVGKK